MVSAGAPVEGIILHDDAGPEEKEFSGVWTGTQADVGLPACGEKYQGWHICRKVVPGRMTAGQHICIEERFERGEKYPCFSGDPSCAGYIYV